MFSTVAMLNKYIHLHNHSEHSHRDGCAKIEEYIKRLSELGMNAFALTEHGSMHSVMEFYNACCDHSKSLYENAVKALKLDEKQEKSMLSAFPSKKIISAAIKSSNELQSYADAYPELFHEILSKEIKPIFGVEAYVIPEKEMAENDDTKHTRHHFVILAKDLEGYHQIVKAVTASQLLKDKKTFPRMTYKDMETYFTGGHTIAMSACIGGEIPKLLLKKDYDGAVEKARLFEKIFGKGNFYIELQNHGMEEELEILPQLIKIGKETGIPCVATNDCHYVNKSDSKIRDMFVAMRFKLVVTDPGFEKDSQQLYLKTSEEMCELFKDVPEAIENTLKIAEQCNVVFEKKKHFPVFAVPGGKPESEFLTDLTYNGLKYRFPDFDSWKEADQKILLDRIEYELDTILTLHYDGYLLIVQDFLAYGRTRGLIGPGRGSAVGSLVSYLIGITNVNPLKYDLIFERFLNKERVSDPDVDSDFAPDIRPLVIQYVQDKYGQDAVCNIITFGTLAAKASIRTAGRVYNVPLNTCDKVAKMVPSKPGITIKKAMEENTELKNLYENSQDVHELIDNALLLEGRVVQTGVHAAGVIIADRAVSDYVPLIYDEDEDIWITQFDKDVCEADIGLLKMDFLGLENLNILDNTIKAVERNYGIKIDLDNIDFDDKEVMKEIFCKGKTKGVFQFESTGMVELLKKFQPNSLEDLILLNAAYRPGPLQYLNGIIEVKHKRKKPKYIIPQMASILDLTYGSPIYQEQIMRIFHEIAGFSLGISDIIRRAMSKKKLKELKKYLPKFKQNLVSAGATEEDADKFCEELMDFASYAFNKSHAAAYAVVAYWTGYMKHYYPVEYMASVLTSADSKKIPVYIKECKDMGIPVLPPSINESGRYFTATSNKTIRFGLGSVKNVGQSCDDILKVRGNGAFSNFQKYVSALLKSRAVFKQVMENLILTGAFDDFGYNRRQMIDGCEKYVKAVKEYEKKKENPKSRQKTIDAALSKVRDISYFDIGASEYDKKYILEKEKELMGFYASGHPLSDYQKVIDEKSDIMIGDIAAEHDGKNITIVGQINQFMPLYKKSTGEPMGKFIVEDLTGEINAIAFTKAFADSCEYIKEGAVVIVKGRIMADEEIDPETNEVIRSDIQIAVTEVEPISSKHKVYIRLKNQATWKCVKALLNLYRGDDKLLVYFVEESRLYEASFNVTANAEMKKVFAEEFGEENIVFVREAS